MQPGLGSQSDDLSSSPAQLSPPAAGPSQMWERTRPYLVPQANPSQASFLPGARPQPLERIFLSLWALSGTQGALCVAFPVRPGGTTEAQSSSPDSDLALPLAPAPWGDRSDRLQADLEG